jgi:hypothetical protein
MDVEYDGIVVEGARELVVVNRVTYGVAPNGAADTHSRCGVDSVLCDRGVGQGVSCEDNLL